jgi:hypothetical protein
LERSWGAVCGGEWEGVAANWPLGRGGDEVEQGVSREQLRLRAGGAGNKGEKKEGGSREESTPLGGLKRWSEDGIRKGEKRAGKSGGRAASRQGRWGAPQATGPASIRPDEVAGPAVAGSWPGGRKLGESRPIAFSRFRHLALRFWNHTCKRERLMSRTAGIRTTNIRNTELQDREIQEH